MQQRQDVQASHRILYMERGDAGAEKHRMPGHAWSTLLPDGDAAEHAAAAVQAADSLALDTGAHHYACTPLEVVVSQGGDKGIQ
jgi:hypothetical protein